MKYAQTTSVSVDACRNEIEKTLKRYGAKAFAYATQDTRALIIFEFNEKRIRFVLNLPDMNERRFTHTEEFMANIVLPNNQTVGEYMLPQIDNCYISNKLPPMIDFGGE